MSDKPPVNNCAKCMRIARREHKAIAAVAVVSPSGKAHWRLADGYTFCGLFSRRAGWDHPEVAR